MAITAYEVIERATADELNAAIAAKIALATGWQPLGFAFVHSPNNQPHLTRLTQVMVQGVLATVAIAGAAVDVTVAAGTSGLASGTAQGALQAAYTAIAGLTSDLAALDDRVTALENP